MCFPSFFFCITYSPVNAQQLLIWFCRYVYHGDLAIFGERVKKSLTGEKEERQAVDSEGEMLITQWQIIPGNLEGLKKRGREEWRWLIGSCRHQLSSPAPPALHHFTFLKKYFVLIQTDPGLFVFYELFTGEENLSRYPSSLRNKWTFSALKCSIPSVMSLFHSTPTSMQNKGQKANSSVGCARRSPVDIGLIQLISCHGTETSQGTLVPWRHEGSLPLSCFLVCSCSSVCPDVLLARQ